MVKLDHYKARCQVNGAALALQKPAGHMGKVELLTRANHVLGEAMLWHAARKCLMWIDLYEPMLCSLDLENGKVARQLLDVAAPIGAIVATTHPDLLIMSHRNGLSIVDLNSLALTPYANPEQNRDGVIYNDMKVDRWGRLWVGTSHDKEVMPRGALWCLKTPHDYRLADAGFAISNGPAFSPDGNTMYFSDSFNREILAYDISPGHEHAQNRRVFARFHEEDGLPDGLTVDASGCVWSAQWNGACIFKLAPSGEVLARYDVPAGNVTSLAFHGTTLFITTARDSLSQDMLEKYPLTGSVFKSDTDSHGLPETLFPL